MIKNEVGKDKDMIETFFLESLKSVYITIVQYLECVPQGDPDFLQNDEMDANEKDGTKSHNDLETYFSH